MQNFTNPIPENELERLISLADLDLDYPNLEENFKDLTLLAAKVAGTEIALINIIDSYTQWTLGSHGLSVKQTPREESSCQYTIMNTTSLEVPDLSTDVRFKDQAHVNGHLALRYYHGFPLSTTPGINLGTLCVLGSQVKTLSPDKIELLEIIAETVVKRLKGYKTFHILQEELRQAEALKKKVAHDIRGPLAGIIGLSEIMHEQGPSLDINEVVELVGLINKSSKSLLELTDEILSEGTQSAVVKNEFNVFILRKKILELYAPQAKYKNINLEVEFSPDTATIPLFRNWLLQISGNLISNAIKFTHPNGDISVSLALTQSNDQRFLKISVADTGVGMDPAILNSINEGNCSSTTGTAGEKGFGFGLSLVSHLVNLLQGTLSVEANADCGTTFTVFVPQPANS